MLRHHAHVPCEQSYFYQNKKNKKKTQKKNWQKEKGNDLDKFQHYNAAKKLMAMQCLLRNVPRSGKRIGDPANVPASPLNARPFTLPRSRLSPAARWNDIRINIHFKHPPKPHVFIYLCLYHHYAVRCFYYQSEHQLVQIFTFYMLSAFQHYGSLPVCIICEYLHCILF